MQDKPTFRSIYIILKDEIMKGSLAKGSLLPPEKKLAEEYSVSRPTIAKAYNLLQDENLIEKKKGFGTTVIYESVDKVYTFGLLLPGGGESEIFSIINDQLLKLSETADFNLLWDGATANNAEIRKQYIETCCDMYINKGVDGIFFSPIERTPDAFDINNRICHAIKKAGIPLILIDRDIHHYSQRNDFDLVGLNNFEAGFVMASHLINEGCEEIYFLHLPHSATSVNLRIIGVNAALIQHKLAFNEHHIICGDPKDAIFIKDHIRFIPGKTGIICANDATAASLMTTLEELEIIVSKDVVVCGYDDMKYSSQFRHPLTSYLQPCTEIANISVELMLRRMINNNRTPVVVSLSGDIIIRNSSRFK